MSLNTVFFCVQICLIKMALSQCLRGNPSLVPESLGFGPVGPVNWPLLLESYSVPPGGLNILSDDLIIEGLVSVAGSLPFLGTVAVEGLLPTEGQGSVLYGCGNGEVAITGEGVGPFGAAVAPARPGFAPTGPGFTPFAPMGPIAPAFAPMGPAFSFGNAPAIDPGMAAAANTAAMAAAANSAGQAAVKTTVGIGAAASASGLTAMAGL